MIVARRARQQCHLVLLSISSNETQFETFEEFQLFPRQISQDLEMLRDSGLVDAIVLPQVEELFKYGPRHGAQVRLESDILPRPYVHLESLAGESTLLIKLLLLMRPHRLYLGECDLIKCAMLRRIIDDLQLVVDVVTLPTVRRDDGIAHDARLQLLGPGELDALVGVYRALRAMVTGYLDDVFEAAELIARGERILQGEPLLKIEHVRVAHPYGFQDIATIDPAVGAALFVRVQVGGVGWRDNVILAPLIPAHEQTIWGLVRSTVAHPEDS